MKNLNDATPNVFSSDSELTSGPAYKKHRRKSYYEGLELEIPQADSPPDIENGVEIQPQIKDRTELLSPKFESWNYEELNNSLELEAEQRMGYAFITKKNVMRWVVTMWIGISTGLCTAVVILVLEKTAELKFGFLAESIDACSNKWCLLLPFCYWCLINVGLSVTGSVLVQYFEPVAGGSGIPQMKCYLNGVKIPRLLRLKTLIVKIPAVVLSVVGGLAIGKEPAATNSGAVFAAGISQGASSSFWKRDFGILPYFRNPIDKRDFVSCGAAAGVSAAFGAPFSGLLFALEEGASFWNPNLVLKWFFCCLVTVFSMNSAVSIYNGHPWELSYEGLVNFGKFESATYSMIEIPVFILMGVFGGLIGAFYNCLNTKLAHFRLNYINRKKWKVLEVGAVALFSASIAMSMFALFDECRPIHADTPKNAIRGICPEGTYSAVGSFWLDQPEHTLRTLLHEPKRNHNPLSLLLFSALYLLLSCLTMGLGTASGLYIPVLLVGGAWGRAVWRGIDALFPQATWILPGKYALIGGAATLGGILRGTICLTAILIEATGNLSLGFPIMLTLVVAKWTGDLFNEGFYEIQIQLIGVPILGWDAPPLSTNIRASDVMSSPAATVEKTEVVEKVIELLAKTKHHSFPVVDGGKLVGLVYRTQLHVCLKERLFSETRPGWEREPGILELFRRHETNNYKIEDLLPLDERERCYHIHLEAIMNQTPYTLAMNSTLPRIFHLFRSLGLRHLIILEEDGIVVGIVTRMDIARYRMERHLGKLKLKKLEIMSN